MSHTQSPAARSLLARLNPLAARKAKPAPAKKSFPYDFYNELSAQNLCTYMVSPGQAVWMERDYTRFAQEAYVRNVVAHRSIAMIAGGAGSIRLKLFSTNPRTGDKTELRVHPLLDLLAHPNPAQTLHAFMTALYTHRLISGNAFVQAVGPSDAAPQELHLLRPDRVSIIAGNNGIPASYRYTINGRMQDFRIDPITWASRILHVKHFHPLNDWYGLSPVEAAAYSIDQHNMAGAWNQALLQNGARPSGALVVKGADGQAGNLSEEQYWRLKNQIDTQFSGPPNAGRPLLLEGGLEWKELSLSPKDMDFVACKQAASRDIALAFGVPPQLLGIPGDNTYSNLAEARLALWEQTILPLVHDTLGSMGCWLEKLFGNGLSVEADISGVAALAGRNQVVWDRVNNCTFLSTNEKRAAVGYGPIAQAQMKSTAFKFDVDQPRVPSGSPDGGQWTSGGGDEDDSDDDGDSSDNGNSIVGDAIRGSGDYLANLFASGQLDGSSLAEGTEVADSASIIVGTTPGGAEYNNKIQTDMNSRGWTPQQIDEAKNFGSNIDAVNKANGNPATRYVHPETGKSVVIDNVTNKVIQVGEADFVYSVESGDAAGAIMRPALNAKPSISAVSEGGEVGGGMGGVSISDDDPFTHRPSPLVKD